MRKPAFLLGFLILVTACGGGGGGGGGGGTSGPAGPPQLEVVFPVATATVSRTSGPIAAGSSVNLRIAVSGMQPASVTASAGTAWETAALSPATPAGASIWTVAVQLPDPLPQAERILFRLTMPDGEIYESSVEELPVSGL